MEEAGQVPTHTYMVKTHKMDSEIKVSMESDHIILSIFVCMCICKLVNVSNAQYKVETCNRKRGQHIPLR